MFGMEIKKAVLVIGILLFLAAISSYIFTTIIPAPANDFPPYPGVPPSIFFVFVEMFYVGLTVPFWLTVTMYLFLLLFGLCFLICSISIVTIYNKKKNNKSIHYHLLTNKNFYLYGGFYFSFLYIISACFMLEGQMRLLALETVGFGGVCCLFSWILIENELDMYLGTIIFKYLNLDNLLFST